MNEWVVVLLAVIFFVLVALAIVALSVGIWLAVHWLGARLRRALGRPVS